MQLATDGCVAVVVGEGLVVVVVGLVVVVVGGLVVVVGEGLVVALALVSRRPWSLAGFSG